MSLLDIIKLLFSAMLITGTFALFVFHKLRSPFMELVVLQKDIKALGRKIVERNVSRRRRAKRKIPKPVKPKDSFRVNRKALICIKKALAKLSDIEKRENELFNVQTSMIAQNSEIETRLQQIDGYCHDLNSNMSIQDTKILQLDNHCRALIGMKIRDSSSELQLHNKIIEAQEDYLTLVGFVKTAKTAQNKHLKDHCREVELTFKDHEESLAIVYGDVVSRLDRIENSMVTFEDKFKKLKRNGLCNL